jgi:hypothetical protein
MRHARPGSNLAEVQAESEAAGRSVLKGASSAVLKAEAEGWSVLKAKPGGRSVLTSEGEAGAC